MQKRPDVYLDIALQALRRVPKFPGTRTLAEYLVDDLCQSAVERQLEIAGDALGQLRKLDAALFDQIPEAALVVAFRNVLAHGYATLSACTRSHRLELPNCCKCCISYWQRCRRNHPTNRRARDRDQFLARALTMTLLAAVVGTG
jgi:uncharacterized protein with HEPN domain